MKTRIYQNGFGQEFRVIQEGPAADKLLVKREYTDKNAHAAVCELSAEQSWGGKGSTIQIVAYDEEGKALRKANSRTMDSALGHASAMLRLAKPDPDEAGREMAKFMQWG